MMARSALPLSDARKVEVETLAAVLSGWQLSKRLRWQKLKRWR